MVKHQPVMKLEGGYLYPDITTVRFPCSCIITYHIVGYIRRRNFRRTIDKFNFEGFIFVLLECQQMLTSTWFNFKEFKFRRTDALKILQKLPAIQHVTIMYL